MSAIHTEGHALIFVVAILRGIAGSILRGDGNLVNTICCKVVLADSVLVLIPAARTNGNGIINFRSYCVLDILQRLAIDGDLDLQRIGNQLISVEFGDNQIVVNLLNECTAVLNQIQQVVFKHID